MNIGVYVGGGVVDVTSGGGFTVQSGLLHALQFGQSSHTFFLIGDGIVSGGSLPVISLRRFVPRAGDLIIKRLWYKILRAFDLIAMRWRYQSFLDRVCCQHRIDMIWFMTPTYVPIRVPYTYTVWDLQHRKQSYFPEVSVTGSTYEQREAHCGSVIPRAAYVITGNEVGQQEVMSFYGVPKERIRIIPLPTPEFALHPPLADCSPLKNMRNPYLFYPAQFWPHKNHIAILLAVALLRDRYGLVFDVVLTGSDKGNVSYIKEKSQELGIAKQVHFLGFVSIEQLVGLYQNAFALVYPSFFGPDNIPPLEAFALGCPVIAAAYAGAEIQLGDAALLFNPCDETDLVLQVKRLHDDAPLRQQLVAKGLQRAHACTCENYVQHINEIIDEFASIRRCWSSRVLYKHS